MKTIKISIIYFFIIWVCSCNQKTKEDVFSKRINNYLIACETNGFSGSLLISKKHNIIFNKGYGLANKEKEIQNSPEIVVDISSVTKQFTATSILKLTEQGLLNLRDSLSLYFKNIPEDKRDITIHQLLTHSAGLVFGIGEGDFDQIPTEQYFQQLFNTELLHAPGSKYEYSNAGYSVLGRIIEIITEKNYETYLKEEIFQVAGMQQTGYLLPDWNTDLVANEYYFNVINKGSQIEKYQRDGKIAWPLKANGGINSTLKDMYKWYQALDDKKIISASSLEMLTTPYIKEYENGNSYYAYGWVTFQSDRGTKVITHNGFNGVSYFDVVWLPEEDIVILFASNSFTSGVSDIAWEVEKMIFEENYTPEHIQKDTHSEILELSENYKGNIDHLSNELEKAFSSKIKNVFNLDRLARMYINEKEYDKALSFTELNNKLYPNEGVIWDTMGEIYFETNQRDKAIHCFNKALELKSEDSFCFWCEHSSKQLEKLKLQ